MSDAAPGKSVLSTYRLLNGWGVLNKRRAIACGGMAVLSVLFESIGVAMIHPILEYIQAGMDIEKLRQSSGMWRTIADGFALLGLPVTLFWLCMVVVVLTIMRQYFTYRFSIDLNAYKHNMARRLTLISFSKIIASNALYLQAMGSGNFVNMLDHQSQAVGTMVRSYIALWMIIVTFVAYISIMVIAAPLSSLLAISLAGLVVISAGRYIRKSRSLSGTLVTFRADYTKLMNETYRAWRTIKLMNTAEVEAERIGGVARRFQDLSIGLVRTAGMIQLLITPLMTAIALIGLYISVTYLDLTLSAVTLFLMIFIRLIPAAQNLATTRQTISTYTVSLDYMARIFSEADAQRERDTGTRIFGGVKREISYRAVRFSYPDGNHAALNGVTATIPAGKITAIVGPSGAGKSTFADCLPRLVVPQGGELTIDDVPLSEFTLASLRGGISFASQEPFVFSGSILDNLRYGNPDASPEEVETACQRAFAHDFIQALPQGYQTLLGEAGTGLSGGQRQRLALARVFLQRAPVVVLDEPTSALDHEAEVQIRLSLRALAEQLGATVIVIAHRNSTILNADHIILLDGGKCVAQGRIEDMRRSQPWFDAMLNASSDVAGAEHA